MLRGLTTITYYADDLTAAKDWYTEVLGVEAYFVREADGKLAYVEFRLGDHLHELGLLASRFAPHELLDKPSGVVAYWAVDDIEASFERLLSLGATVHDKPTERGPGYVTASVRDPFGNILGVMYNEHYLAMVNAHA